MNKKKVLAALVMLSLMQGSVYAENITSTIKEDKIFTEDSTINVNDTTYDNSGSAIESSDNDITITLKNGSKLSIYSNAYTNNNVVTQGAVFTNNSNTLKFTGDGELEITQVYNEKQPAGFNTYAVYTNAQNDKIIFDNKSVVINDGDDKGLRGAFVVDNGSEIRFTENVDKLQVNYTNDTDCEVWTIGDRRYVVSVGDDDNFIYDNKNGEIDFNLNNSDVFYLSGGNIRLEGKLTDINMTETDSHHDKNGEPVTTYLVYLHTDNASWSKGPSNIKFNADLTKVIGTSGIYTDLADKRGTVEFNGDTNLSFKSDIADYSAGSFAHVDNTDLVFNGQTTHISSKNTNANLSSHMGIWFDNSSNYKKDPSTLTAKNDFFYEHSSSAASSYAIYTGTAGNKLNFENATIKETNNKAGGKSYGLLLRTDSQLNATGNFNVLAQADASAYGLYISGAYEVNLTGAENKLAAVGGNGAAIAVSNSEAAVGSEQTTRNVLQGGKNIDEEGNITGKGALAVWATSGGTLNVTGKENIVYGNVQATEASTINIKADSGNMQGQLQVWNGSNLIYDKLSSDNGLLKFYNETDDVLYTISNTDNISTTKINHNAVISSQQDTKYHKVNNKTKGAAIRAEQNSEVTLEKAVGIYGDIIAVGAENKVGGKVTVNSVEDAEFKGDVLAGNSGEITLTLNGASYEGRVDDYADASLKGIVFRPDEFDVDVTEGGTVNMTLNNSAWTARGQNFVTKLDFGAEGGLVDLSQDENNSVTIRNLNGNGTFNMLLNSEDHSKSDMLYIGKNTGSQTINIVGGITGGLKNISEDNPLRFATVGIDSVSDAPDVNNSGIKAYTRDAGFADIEYYVDKEDYDTTDDDNVKYNGAGD